MPFAKEVVEEQYLADCTTVEQKRAAFQEE
jgi:hypothetical protein